jgi:hypothetical protein
MAYALGPMGFGLCHIGHGESKAIYYLLPIKIKAKTSGKRQREREREKERKKERQISNIWGFEF